MIPRIDSRNMESFLPVIKDDYKLFISMFLHHHVEINFFLRLAVQIFPSKETSSIGDDSLVRSGLGKCCKGSPQINVMKFF